VRLAVPILALAALAACNTSGHNKDAVRQGIVDYLAKMGLNTNAMDVSVTSIDFKNTEADATASIALKGAGSMPPMSRKYHLQQKGSQWEVVASADAGANPHGGGAMPGAGGGGNPHAAGGPPAPPAGSTKMPSPEDLPPSGKKQ